MKLSGGNTIDKRDLHATGQGQMSKVKVTEVKTNFATIWAFQDRNFRDGLEIMHKAWSNIKEVPYCFSRSSVEFQGHTGQTTGDFDPS